MFRRKISGCILVFFLACPAIAWAQFPTGFERNNSISVFVQSQMGGSFTNLVRVELFRGNMPLEETFADMRGEVFFPGLEDGGFQVRVSTPGYRTMTREIELNGDHNRSLRFLLQPGADVGAVVTVASEPSVSRRWLAAPKKARERVREGRALHAEGKHKKALKNYRQAVEIAPDFVIAWNDLGLCYRKANKDAEARKAFETGIAADPKFLLPYLNLAELLTGQEKYNEAAQVLARASRAVPDRGEPFYQMARIQFDTGHLDRAEQASRMALERDASRIPEVHILLVNIYSRQGENEKALDELRAYLEQAPDGEFAESARTRLEKLAADK